MTSLVADIPYTDEKADLSVPNGITEIETQDSFQEALESFKESCENGEAAEFITEEDLAKKEGILNLDYFSKETDSVGSPGIEDFANRSGSVSPAEEVDQDLPSPAEDLDQTESKSPTENFDQSESAVSPSEGPVEASGSNDSNFGETNPNFIQEYYDETSNQDESSNSDEVQLLNCIICNAVFETRKNLSEHILTHLKKPKLVIRDLKSTPKRASFARKRIRPYKNFISQVIEPEANPDNPNYPAIPKLRILLPSQLSQQVDNAIESSKSKSDNDNFMRPLSASSNSSIKSEMVPNDSPSFHTQTTDLNSFWGHGDNESHTSSDSGIQIRESGEKEVERHDSLLQNFLNDTVTTKDSSMILPGPIDTEFISLDRLAGPQCQVCHERYVDKASFEIHCKATGHYNPSSSSHNSLVPYGSNNMLSNPLESLSNLSMSQIAQSVNRLHQNGPPVQQNVMINIQQFGHQMPQRSHFDMPPHHMPPHPMYPPPNSMYHPMGPHAPPMGPHVPPHGPPHPQYPNNYPPHPMYYPGGGYPPHTAPHQAPRPPVQPRTPPQGSMMPPRPPPPRPQQPQPRPPQNNQERPQIRPPIQRPTPQQRPPIMRPGPPQNVRPPQNRPPQNQQRPPVPPGSKITLLKRNGTPPNQNDIKKKRMDVLIPDTNDDADCHVISMQKCNDGLPVIKNVQGAATVDPIVHLTDSITLSVRNPKDSPKEVPQPAKKNDAKAVANILATRGITVTPASKPQKEVQITQSSVPPKPPPVAINLNSAVSIIPTAKNNSNTQPQSKPIEKAQTVDLTDDEPKSQTAQPQPVKRSLPYTCDLCPAQYPTMKSLMTHRRQYHKAGPHGELGIPIVDLSQATVLAKLQSLGIQNYIPLPQSGTNGTFGMPIVSVNGARNPSVCNLGALGSGAVLTLGPLHRLNNLPINTNKQ